jgi:hypothetical protein
VEFVELVSSILALLVIAPGHPEQGAFFLLRGLLKTIPMRVFKTSSPNQGIIYCRIVMFLATMAQKKFPYKIPGGFFTYFKKKMQFLFFNQWTAMIHFMRRILII